MSARFTLQLASFHEKESSKALAAITDFLMFVVTVYLHKLTLPLFHLRTMGEIDSMARGGTETTDNMNDRMNESITQIKVHSLRDCVSSSFLYSGLRRTKIPPYGIPIEISMTTKGLATYSTQ